MYTCALKCIVADTNVLTKGCSCKMRYQTNVAISVDVEKGSCCGQGCHDQCQEYTNTGRVKYMYGPSHFTV